MEDQFCDMPPLSHDFLLAVPGTRERVVHLLADSFSALASPRPKARNRTVACGFPQRRLRVTVRMDRIHETG